MWYIIDIEIKIKKEHIQMIKNGKAQLSSTIPADLLEQLRLEALIKRTTVSEIVTKLLKEKYDKKPKIKIEIEGEEK